MFNFLRFFAISLVLAGNSLAANTRIVAGGTLTLSQDLVLTGTDTLEINGTVGDSCTVTGNKHAITTTGTWTGLVKIFFTRLNDLGAGGGTAYDQNGSGISLTGSASALIRIEHSSLARCGTVKVVNNGSSSTWFRCNNILVNSTVSIDQMPDNTGFVFHASGSSTAQKYYQGNFTAVAVTSIFAPQWLIGGPGDTNSNIFIGNRVTLDAGGNGTLISYNYWHNPAKWTQVHTVTNQTGSICEHNVIRDGEWIVRMCSGEFRDNVVCDIYDHDLYQGGNYGRFYRNLWLGYDPPGTNNHGQQYPNMSIYNSTDIWSPGYGTTGVDIFNNVFDGGEFFMMPAIGVGSGAWINTMRNNVFCGFKLDPTYAGGGLNITRGGDSGDVHYADYNCFYNPSTPGVDNYAFTVPGKTERVSDGFAKHDLPANGAVDAQVNPMFKGPRVTAFPYTDADILAKRVTVSQMIREFFDRYTPATGSPLIDAGDPADGIGTDIGAVQTGTVGIGEVKFKAEVKGMQLEARPNPFMAQTMFTISIGGKASGVELGIYNMQGKLIQSLLSGHFTPHASRFTFTWNASVMPAGIYVAELRAGKTVCTKKLLLIK